MARSLDQGERWSVSQPVADPEEIPLEELPWPASLTREDLAQVDLSALGIPGLPQGAAVEYWVCYTVSDHQMTAEIAIRTDGDVPQDLYAGQLEGPLVYDGRALSLGRLSYTPY